MSKKILFIANNYMDLHKDIIAEMERQNYEVDFIAEQFHRDDPNNIRGFTKFSKKLVNEKKFNKKIEQIWIDILNSDKYNKTYDFCFVLDGQSLSPILFKTLRERNSNVKIVNYLFDTTTEVYHFEKNFPFFDKIFSFDICEVEKYHINFLPIYWVPCDGGDAPKYDIFGFGAIKNDRFTMFSRLERIAQKNGLSYFLKLYNFLKIHNMFLYRIRCAIFKRFHIPNIITPKAILSSFATKETISPSDFRLHIAGAKIIIDTSSPFQDGLTARYMWSLGLGKKIITSNANARRYDFFDEKQVLVYSDSTTDEQIEEFLTSKYEMTPSQKERVIQYRLDNWLKTMLD